MSGLSLLVGIALATLVSEDATVLAAGLAVGNGTLDWVPAVTACASGIYIGDLGLWLAGRLAGRRALEWPRVAAFREGVRTAAGWMDRHPALALLGSRFVPGTRLPLYVAAGAEGQRPAVFAFWSLIAVLLWTPLIVSTAALLGAGVIDPIQTWLGSGWTARVLLFIGLVLVMRHAIAPGSAGESRAASWHRRLGRWRHWEFWPSWLFNLPVVLWVLLLAIRHRSVTLFTLANPGIADGGFVGESKSAILACLPAEWVLPWTVIGPGTLDARVSSLRRVMADRGLSYPLVFKPDVGQRGAAVRWVGDDAAAQRYFATVEAAVLVQVPHDGPFEAGLFYVRRPSERMGRVVSITDKRFPVVTGDGTSTVGQLVQTHARYRLQTPVFHARLGARWREVPAAGECVALGRAGNHCQGTEFRDGQALATPALERRIDSIAKAFPGFYYGRFDVRYRTRDGFMAGNDLAIIELNGVTSEATHIYDPSASLLSGWWTAMCQWSIAFAIGDENRTRGFEPAPLSRLARAAWTFVRSRSLPTLSD